MPNSIQVIMPQVGEGISEATIVKWHKAVGDVVEEGETLLEITTAKIDVEIPAPGSGIVHEIRFPEDTTVLVDTVIAVLGKERKTALPAPPPVSAGGGGAAGAKPSGAPAPALARPATPAPGGSQSVGAASGARGASAADPEVERRQLMRSRSSPFVRDLAREMGIDLAQVPGSGLHGRVTRRDLEVFVERKEKMTRKMLAPSPASQVPRRLQVDSTEAAADDQLSEEIADEPQVAQSFAGERVESMSSMRRQIAEHMARSFRRSPHAFTVFEVDFTRAERLRVAYRDEFQKQFDAKLTAMVFLLRALGETLPRFPVVNAFLRNEKIVHPECYNIGVAVAVPNGLVVPVVHDIERKTCGQLAQELQDKAARARQGKLVLADVDGGTFTVTNPGQLGCMMGIPIINQPQSAILHVGGISKMPAVVTGKEGEDFIAIRHKAVLTLGFDHRLIDGWEADSFMGATKECIEEGDFNVLE